jgi:hypothetical protein
MSTAVPSQHPAVVLRSHYQHVRALLVIATITVLALTLALVIVVTNSGTSSNTRLASSPAQSVKTAGHQPIGNGALATTRSSSVRYDGGPEEGTAGHQPTGNGVLTTRSSSVRYDGGPEEGTAAH